MISARLHWLGSVAASAMFAAMPAMAQTVPAQPQAQAPAQSDGGKIVVTGKQSEISSAPDRLSFNVANDLQVQTGTVADALRAVPGVEVDLQGNVSLRGDSGVRIMIDGRPSAMMNGDSRGDVLQSMASGNIERVEVITNPSAAFSPEGSGGVINLVTKKARPGARSATVRATIGTRRSGGLNLSGVTSKPGLTVSGDIGYRQFGVRGEAEQRRSRRDPLSGNWIDSRQDSTIRNVAKARNGRVAVEVDLDKVNRISAELSARSNTIDATRIDDFAGPGVAYRRVSELDMRNRNLGFNGSWRRTLPGDGHELAVEIEADRGDLRRDVRAATTPGVPAGAAGYERIVNAAERGDYGVKVDYKRPIGEGQSLNLGYEFDLGRYQFDYSGGRGPGFAALTPVPGLTNRFDYMQAIHAWYATFKFDLGKLELQPGVRAEQADLDIDQITDNIRVDDGYFRVYPTLHLGYELSAKQKLRASYSRRIQRPSPQDLNPYTLYIDPQNVRRGNPRLRPEVTDSFELAWQLRDGGTFYSATGFYRKSRGGVTDVYADIGGGVLLSTRANLATTRRAGVELLANGKLSKTLSYNASGTLLWNRIDPRIAGISTPRSGTTGTVRANLTWQPTARDYFQLNASYSGDQLIAQGYRKSGGVLNLGYRRKIDERFNLILSAQNVLDSVRQKIVIDTPLIRDRLTQRGNGQTFLLSLSYTLGSASGKKRQEPGFDFDGGGNVAQ